MSGDGDGDGTADEHHRYSKNGIKEKIKKAVDANTQKRMIKTYEKTNVKYMNSSEGKYLHDEYSKPMSRADRKTGELWNASDKRLKEIANDSKWRKEYKEDLRKANEYEIKYEVGKSKAIVTALIKKYGVEKAAKWTDMPVTKSAEELIDRYIDVTKEMYDRSDDIDDAWLDEYK